MSLSLVLSPSLYDEVVRILGLLPGSPITLSDYAEACRIEEEALAS